LCVVMGFRQGLESGCRTAAGRRRLMSQGRQIRACLTGGGGGVCGGGGFTLLSSQVHAADGQYAVSQRGRCRVQQALTPILLQK
jgi:hypothetical protein